jgi:hypothetical protein
MIEQNSNCDGANDRHRRTAAELIGFVSIGRWLNRVKHVILGRLPRGLLMIEYLN